MSSVGGIVSSPMIHMPPPAGMPPPQPPPSGSPPETPPPPNPPSGSSKSGDASSAFDAGKLAEMNAAYATPANLGQTLNVAA